MNSAAGTRILLIDDHALFREGLVRLLESEPDFEVTGRAQSAREGLDLLSARTADVVLLDFDLGSERAVDFLAEMRSRGFPGKILIVTAGVSDQESVQLVQAGVAGIFHKHNPPELLCECIRQVAAGDVWLEKSYLRPLFQSMDPARALAGSRLTDRERQVLRGVFRGLANKEIGHQLAISESSVKGTLQQLFQKMNVRTRSQLVRVALEQYRDQI